jgi:hypothetical protein
MFHPIAEAWLVDAHQWKDILTFPKINIVSKPMKVHKQSEKPFMPSEIRKRRRKDTSKLLPTIELKSIIGPKMIGIQYPLHFAECSQTLVNAIATILPLDVKLNLFGYAHSMILVGCLFKHNNLSWIILNRMNLKIYIGSHFVADALHLFSRNRHIFEMNPHRKFPRQGINEIITLATSVKAREMKLITKLNCLPKGVLRFNQTEQSFQELFEFLRCVGPAGFFLPNFSRKIPHPSGFNVPGQELCVLAKGWKVFKKTESNGLNCISTCNCSNIKLLKQTTEEETIGHLIANVPSSLSKTNDFEAHFAPFVQFIQANPNLLFFPKQDILI